MLFLLSKPVAFLGAGIAIVVAVVAQSVAQAAAARALGDRMPASTGRLSLDPRKHLDPFGVVVLLIACITFPKPMPLQEPRFRGGRGRYLAAILAGPFVNLLLAVAGLAALSLVEGGFVPSPAPNLGSSLSLDLFPDSTPAVLLFEFAAVNAGIGVLALFPIPPLVGARILWLYAPRSHGWQTARYKLEEQNFGLGIVVLLLIPLFGGLGLLSRLVFAVSGAFLQGVCALFGVDYFGL